MYRPIYVANKKFRNINNFLIIAKEKSYTYYDCTFYNEFTFEPNIKYCHLYISVLPG